MEKELTFEESLEKLRELTEKVKRSDTNLQESIRCLEEGIQHYEYCKKVLSEAEQKIETIEIE